MEIGLRISADLASEQEAPLPSRRTENQEGAVAVFDRDLVHSRRLSEG